MLSPFATFGIVFIVAVFALLQKEDLRDRMIRLLGANDLHGTTVAIDDGARRLSRYFLTQLTINTAFGVVIGAGLLIIGLPNPVLWGILSGLLRFVPYVGSLISAVLPIALAAAVEPGWSMVLWTAGLYVVVEGLTGQVIEPLVYGNSTGCTLFGCRRGDLRVVAMGAGGFDPFDTAHLMPGRHGATCEEARVS